MGCPLNTAGSNVPAGDCKPNAGYHGLVTATSSDPYYVTTVQLCTSQGTAVCTTDAILECATKAGHTSMMACAEPVAGYSALDGGIAVGMRARVYPCVRRPGPTLLLLPFPRP